MSNAESRQNSAEKWVSALRTETKGRTEIRQFRKKARELFRENLYFLKKLLKYFNWRNNKFLKKKNNANIIYSKWMVNSKLNKCTTFAINIGG